MFPVMIRLRMLIDELNESHLACVDGIRLYIEKHHLDWDYQVINRRRAATIEPDARLIVFHARDLVWLAEQMSATSSITASFW